MTKPKLNVHLIVSQGEITMLEMNECTSAEDRVEITNEIGKLITLRNFIEAKILDFEKDMQQSFRKKTEPVLTILPVKEDEK